MGNRTRQLEMAPGTLAQLRKHGVTDQARLRLEYFFYTDTEAKAAALVKRLAEWGYSGGCSAHNDEQYVITGWTPRMTMDDQTVGEWVGRMCDVGYDHDCEFDGWGTYPEQP